MIAFLVLSILAWRFLASRKATTHPLPPGPPSDPIIGHFRIAPTERAELRYEQWSRETKSDVIYLNIIGQSIVVLNSAKSAVDLMDKRGSIYSDRPSFDFLLESGWADNIGFLSTGPQFRRHRKIFQNAFSPANIVQYCGKQETLAQLLLGQIVQRPEHWRDSVKRYSASLILAIAYEINVSEGDDPYINNAEKVSSFVANSGPVGGTLVDIIPLLRRLPSWVTIFPSLVRARGNRSTMREFYGSPFAHVKSLIAHGTPGTSFARSMLDVKASAESGDKASELTEAEIQGAAAAS